MPQPTAPTSGPDADFRLRSIAVSAYGPTVVAAVGAGAVLPVVALSALALGASPSVAALTAGLTLVAELFFAVPAGALVHRIGERRALLLGERRSTPSRALSRSSPRRCGCSVSRCS